MTVIGVDGVLAGQDERSLPVGSTAVNQCAYDIGGRVIELFTDSRVFAPTLTTSLLTQEVLREGVDRATALDLGCGLGPIAILLAKCGCEHVWAIDLMPRACELTRQNASLNGVAAKITVCEGNLFCPVEGMRFDVIVDDVSGVAAQVARVSSWFPDDVPLGGEDGTDLAIEMLEKASNYLAPGGRLYFPVLSLSKSDKLVKTAQRYFRNRVTCIASKKIPFSPQLKANLQLLSKLRQDGVIQFDQVRSRLLWTLDVYRATAPS